MKKKLLFLCAVLTAVGLQSQNFIPNPSFESWTHLEVELPTHYVASSSEEMSWRGLNANATKTQPAHHGLYALKLVTNGDYLGWLLNTDPGDGGDPADWKNGMPVTGRPTGMRGYYKYNTAVGDAGMVMVVFRKNGQMVGNYSKMLTGPKSSFELFDLTFSPALTVDPDSMIIAFASSFDYMSNNMVDGSTLILDSISLTGVTTQPPMLNGSFEEWETKELGLFLDGWNEQNLDMPGINRTSDAKDLTYGIELTTFSYTDEEDQLRIHPGYITTGYWDDFCGCIKGGKPFTYTKGVLSFWYKYFPKLNDQAQVELIFHKTNTQFINHALNLNAASQYTYAEIPFDLGHINPEHVVIQAISSLWSNRASQYDGSRLILDKLEFKNLAFPTNTDNATQLPLTISNTSSELFVHTELSNLKAVTIYNLYGKLLLESNSNRVDISHLSTGLYIVKTKTNTAEKNFKFIKN